MIQTFLAKKHGRGSGDPFQRRPKQQEERNRTRAWVREQTKMLRDQMSSHSDRYAIPSLSPAKSDTSGSNLHLEIEDDEPPQHELPVHSTPRPVQLMSEEASSSVSYMPLIRWRVVGAVGGEGVRKNQRGDRTAC